MAFALEPVEISQSLGRHPRFHKLIEFARTSVWVIEVCRRDIGTMWCIFATNELNGLEILTGLLGGLALFLYGMHKMSDGLKAAAGDSMRKLLQKLTTNRFMAAITGAIVTAVIQSSSVTTVLVVGFVSAGLMTLSQSVGVIMGANVGTTVTAQIIAFRITDYAWAMVAIGFAAWSFGRNDRLRSYGAMMMGLGMLFLGMGQMGDATSPLRTFQPFIDFMARLDNRLLAMLVGAAFTALVQSSSATTGIVIMLASQGFLSLEAGISLAIGAKVGTCVTAVLAAIGKKEEAQRVAAVHVLFNVLGAALWFFFIPQLAELARSVSPGDPDLQGVEKLAAETPRQVANAITIFAVGNLAVMIWFVGPIAKLAEKIIPDRPEPAVEVAKPLYLDNAFLSTPSLALDRVRLEMLHIGHRVVKFMKDLAATLSEGDARDLEKLKQQYEEIDQIYGETLSYLTRIGRAELTTPETARLEKMLEIGTYLQSICDLVGTNLIAVSRERMNAQVVMSSATLDKMRELGERVATSLDDVLMALESEDRELALSIVGRKSDVYRRADELLEFVGQRLLSDDPKRVETYRFESDIIALLKRLYYYVRRIAKVISELSEETSSTSLEIDEVGQRAD